MELKRLGFASVSIQTLRKIINRSLRMDVIWLGRHHDLRDHLEQVLRTHQIDTVIDVGANQGQFGSLVRTLNFKGTLHSFEPVKAAYAALAGRASADSKWTTHHVALGSEIGRGMINVSKSSTFSSFLKPNTFGLNRARTMAVTHQQEIDISTLDEFTKAHLDTVGRIFLKMDTQGYDLNVLKGAHGTLAKVYGILSEVSFVPIYENMPSYLEALSVYREHGFAVSGMYPVNRNHDLSLIEADCVMVRMG